VEETQGLIAGYDALVKQAEILYQDGVWRLQRSLPRALHFERVPAQMKAKSGEYAKSLLGRAPVLLGSLLQAMAKFLIVALLTLVLSYWTLKEYHPIGRRLLAFVPSQYAGTAISLSRQINKLVSSYLLGLLTMCVIAAAIATAILLLFRVDYAFLLGLLIGAAYAIPYFGMPLALIISAIVAAVTGHSGGNILAFAICIMILNGILDYFGTPRIIGKRVNLHPMTIIFAVVAAGELFGFLGVLIAVPLAAAVRLCLAEFFPEFFGNNSEAPEEKAAAQQKSESVSKEKGRKKKR
jgi:predicted PurR-regulated permease PerM